MYENIFDDHIHLTCTISEAANIIRKHLSSSFVSEYTPNESVRIINLLLQCTGSQSFMNAMGLDGKYAVYSMVKFINIVITESNGGCDFHLTVSNVNGRWPDIEYNLYHGDWKKIKKSNNKNVYEEFTPAMYELLHFCPDFEFDD